MRFYWLQETFEGLKIAWDAIRANKLRAVLTTLGIVIGIVTVSLMGTAIEGLNKSFMNAVSGIGADVLYVQRFSWFISSHEEWIKSEKRQPIRLDQVRALQRQLTQALAVAPAAEDRATIRYKNKSSGSVSVVGTTDQFLLTRGAIVREGRFLSPGEAAGGRPVCVIGSGIATNLFLHESPIGARVRLGRHSFEVVGVLEAQGDFFGDFSSDKMAIIPIGQFMTHFSRQPDYQIQVKVRNLAQIEDAKEEVRGVMRKVRRLAPGDEDDFSIDEQGKFISTFERVSGTIAAAGLFITGLSLFVGGIGIMNIMFVSVAERTREIGIRKAIGAKRRAILIQFLIEAASVCLIGGLVGLAITLVITFALHKYLATLLSPTIVALAILVSLVVGVVSGFLPAWRAARMDPVEALRNE